MDRQIEDLMKQGLSRNEIFEQLKKQSSNQMRLANKIATFEHGTPSTQTVLLNRVLMALCLLQACFGIWVISMWSRWTRSSAGKASSQRSF